MSEHTVSPKIEQLIDAHLNYLELEFSQSTTIHTEFQHFSAWFQARTLQDFWSAQQLQQLIQQQFLNTALSQNLLSQIATHLHFALSHDLNESTKIEDVVDVLSVDQLAQYIASKTEHRQKLVHIVVNHPAFNAMVSQLIQQALQDYLDHSVAMRVPGVGSFLKMGKSVLQSVTDGNLEQVTQQYLQKNISKLSQMSEQILNQHFDDEKLYLFQANVWHQIKTLPLTVLKNYIVQDDLPKIIALINEFWDYTRQSDYLQQQLHDGIYTWYIRNSEKPIGELLRDLNIQQDLVKNELATLIEPIIQSLVSSGYLRQRSRLFLEKFYYSADVKAIIG
ncbi:MAG: hypothetical protein QM666_00115 [Acinetobacter sp.]